MDRQQKYDSNNIFARIVRGEVECEKLITSDHSLAFYDINPQDEVHVLVICKGRYRNFYDFQNNASQPEKDDFWETTKKVIEKKALLQNGYKLITNHGRYGNQEVEHFHVHLLSIKGK